MHRRADRRARAFGSMLAAVLGTFLMVGSVPSVSAHPVRSCPFGASGFELFEIHGTPGDPAPGAGDEPLWDRFVQDAETAFGSLAGLMEAFGFETEVDLYAFLLGGWLGWDKNGDRHICVQDLPDTSGTPAFIWNGIDNSAKVPG